VPKWTTPIALYFLERGYNWLAVRCSGNMRRNMPGEFVGNNLPQEFERIRSGSLEVVRRYRDMKNAGGECSEIFSWRSPDYRNATMSYLKKLWWMSEKRVGWDIRRSEGSIREDTPNGRVSDVCFREHELDNEFFTFVIGEGSRSWSSLSEIHFVEASPFNKTSGEKDSGRGSFGSSFD
jgi:hypothetical protein